ncbi:hypothetical protein H9P43_009466 [Blastocladiella emersonii ATCC 22665]|nr:hypothetical protein H9P43_009466 [Blastocladiella emersonii ATCC 22665]
MPKHAPARNNTAAARTTTSASAAGTRKRMLPKARPAAAATPSSISGKMVAANTRPATDGDLWMFGLNNWGQCGRPTFLNPCYGPDFITLPPETSVVAAAGGEHHTFALLDDGRVLAFGRANGCELGLGAESGSILSVDNPTALPAFSAAVRKTAVGAHHNVAITEDGKVYRWGTNDMGQLGTGSAPFKPDDATDDLPSPLAFDFSKSGATGIATACGAQHTVLLLHKPATAPASG